MPVTPFLSASSKRVHCPCSGRTSNNINQKSERGDTQTFSFRQNWKETWGDKGQFVGAQLVLLRRPRPIWDLPFHHFTLVLSPLSCSYDGYPHCGFENLAGQLSCIPQAGHLPLFLDVPSVQRKESRFPIVLSDRIPLVNATRPCMPFVGDLYRL